MSLSRQWICLARGVAYGGRAADGRADQERDCGMYTSNVVYTLLQVSLSPSAYIIILNLT